MMTDFPNYLGCLIILLAVLGLWKSKINLEYKIFFLVSIIFAFSLSLGKYLPALYEFFYNNLPFFGKFRAPAFILIILQFSMLVLATCGISELYEFFKKYLKISLTLFFSLIIMVFMVKPSDSEISKITKKDFSKSEFIKDYNKQIKEKGISLEKEKKILKDFLFDKQDNYTVGNFKISSIDLNQDALIYFAKYGGLPGQNSTINSISIKKGEISDEELKKEITELLISTKYRLLSQDRNFQTYNFQVEEHNKIHEEFKSGILSDYTIIISIFILLSIFAILIYKFNINFKPQYLIILVMLICIYDYYRVNREIIVSNRHTPYKEIIQHSNEVDRYFQKNDLVKHLEKDEDVFRVYDLAGNSNRLASFNIENLDGSHPVKLDKFDDFKNSLVYYQQYEKKIPKNFLKAFNVKYLIDNSPNQRDGFYVPVKTSMYDIQRKENMTYYIHELQDFQERMFFVNNIIKDNVPTKEVTKQIEKDSIQTKQFIESSWPVKKDAYVKNVQLSSQNIKHNNNAKVNIIKSGPGRIEFETSCDECETNQFLFISEIYYPGWEVYNKNNSKETHELYRTNEAFMGMLVPPGENSFVLEFKSKSLRIGKIISYLSYAILFLLLGIGIYRKKKLNESL